MSVDYRALRAENTRRYGTDIGRIGRMLLADRYDKRTHFLFELLQNAEDALRRRVGWSGSRIATFRLSQRDLRFSHYGRPFDAEDVKGVCGIAESTKGVTAIGRFGIGFKSVYALSDRPEIHSGNEQFAIENYVHPVAVPPIERERDQTVIVLPLTPGDADSQSEILRGMVGLDVRTLLFLQHIEEIVWRVDDGPSGHYQRSSRTLSADGTRFVSLVGTQDGQADKSEEWVVFSRTVRHEAQEVGNVELAFQLGEVGNVVPALDAPLVVFFPTIVPTHLGFVVQGPYRTTPSRDNVPIDDVWNQALAEETASLLVDALQELRVSGQLDVGALECLPLERSKFRGRLLEPLFDRILTTFKEEAFLPASTGGYVSAESARISRTQELRELISPTQLGELLGLEGDVHWLSGEISADRTPELRHFLIRELDVSELAPDTLINRLTKQFLEAQPDEWIGRLYVFLRNQPALLAKASVLPIIRLEEGSHVPAYIHGEPQAFLPTGFESGFPTVRARVCELVEALEFVKSLGLTVPDPVDDVIRNILPKYQEESSPDVDEAEYASDIGKILRAYKTDSQTKKNRLVEQLRRSMFVRAWDAKSNERFIAVPQVVHLPTARLRELFAGVDDILFVDHEAYPQLRGEDARELLEACGASRYISPSTVSLRLTWEERRALRGSENVTKELHSNDQTLRGLESLLSQLESLNRDQRQRKARLLWDALIELLDRRGQAIFKTEYRWVYYTEYAAETDAAFIRLLNATAWVPDRQGNLCTPSQISFEQLEWRTNPFLQSVVQFRPPIIDELAREAGIEPEVLEILRALNLTSVEELKARLGIRDEESDVGNATQLQAQDTSVDKGENAAPHAGAGRPAAARHSGRRFISYVAVELDGATDAASPNGGEHEDRMALEDEAIRLILQREPFLKRMPVGNVGFDLIDADSDGNPERWIEVKAMAGTLEDRPVGLSAAQHEFARQHGEQYWLYIVERAAECAYARIVKIQDPTGKAGSYTFDHGWIAVASIEECADESPNDESVRPTAGT